MDCGFQEECEKTDICVFKISFWYIIYIIYMTCATIIGYLYLFPVGTMVDIGITIIDL